MLWEAYYTVITLQVYLMVLVSIVPNSEEITFHFLK
jgi:hypothetical protein